MDFKKLLSTKINIPNLLKYSWFWLFWPALGLSALSYLFVGSEPLIGYVPKGRIDRGFPFHFFESSTSLDRLHLVQHHFLFSWFVWNAIFYFFISSAVWYLISCIFDKKWLPLVLAIILGLVAMEINIHSSTDCVTGFPIQFHIVCIDDGSISTSFLIFGYIFNSIFWFSVMAVIVALVTFVSSNPIVRKFLIYKDILLTLESGLLLLLGISIMGLFGNTNGIAGITVLSIILFPLIYIFRSFVKQNPNSGKRLFFSKFGYIMTGVCLALVLISTLFNLTYQPGAWFNFRDFGFVLISLPLSSLFPFQVDNQVFSSRLVLYLIVFLNLILVIGVSDIVGILSSKLYIFLKNIINGILSKKY